METVESMESEFIVVGAGSAGNVIARRLIDAGKTVTVIEAGGYDTNPLIPDLWQAVGLWHGPEDWDFYTVEQDGCHGRSLHIPRGKVMGGSHALNGTIWCRGARQDFDNWAYMGCPGWSWEDVLPTFKAMENYDGGGSEFRGESGPLDVRKDYAVNPIQESILEAGIEIGLPLNEDYNDGDVDGISRIQLNVRDGHRFNTWHAYLQPVVDDPNLRIITGSEVRRLIIDDETVTGVEYISDGEVRRAIAGETILTAGALGSPVILQRSGIGAAEELESVGVTPVIDAPGVGKNLQDHFLVPVVYSTDAPVPQPETGVSETHHFWRSSPDLTVPDTQPLHFSIPMYLDDMTGPDNGFSLVAGLIRPEARGTVQISGPEVTDEIRIDLGALDNDNDLRALVASVRQCRSMGRTAALTGWGAQELYPGPDTPDDDDSLGEYVRSYVNTYHHQVGTCRMGIDSGAVIDPRSLRVNGVAGLRVADASVLPAVTTGNTNAPVILVAEKAAEFITGITAEQANQASISRP